MLRLLRQRPYRIILTANFISLLGSGLNHASIIWFVLEQTHSEKAVALLVSVITLPTLLVLPFTGLLIDRMDRRYTSIALDVGRGSVVALVAFLAFRGQAQVWHIYAMGVALGLGAFMFWPNMAALTQEMVTAEDVVPVNALVMGSAQAGWMIAGALVGFLYRRIGLGGMLALDASSYALSALLMFRLRRGKHLVSPAVAPAETATATAAAATTVRSFLHELAAGLRYSVGHRRVLIFGAVSALFNAAMISQNVLTAPLNRYILRSGATGFGFSNAGWSLGAILASGWAGVALRHGRKEVKILWLALLVTGSACAALPYSGVLAIAVTLYFAMGSGRGLAGVAIGSALMHEIPRELMGRTQNVFTFAWILLQLMMTMAVGWLSENVSLATGFFVVAGSYLAGGLLAITVARQPAPIPILEPIETAESVVAEVKPAELEF